MIEGRVKVFRSPMVDSNAELLLQNHVTTNPRTYYIDPEKAHSENESTTVRNAHG